ncbi:hypothetical protein Clacol_010136 [Clathrus columnatus]|uniref:Cytochrome P450 n=1 Tax=Clathrus columnatus TaxID=1419009 RepID=A0AAV5AQS3_9AGAM|nr:hypothetical protein Clacol_010136 [Clathrus columnatus]
MPSVDISLSSVLEFLSKNRGKFLNALVVYAGYRWWRAWARGRSLPPGPRGLPYFGHYLRWPPKEAYWTLAQKYNFGLFYVKEASMENIIISDYETALDRRSALYSGRPPFILANDYASLGRHMLVMPYGEKWRKMRAAIHPEVTPTKVSSYVPLATAEVKIALIKILKNPEAFHPYGRQIIGNLSFDQMQQVNAVEVLYSFFGVMGGQPLDHIPFLRYLPKFLTPGHRTGMRLQNLTRKCFDTLFDDMLGRISNGQMDSNAAMAARWWKDREVLGFDKDDVSMLAGTMFEGATDTTAGLMWTFMILSVSHPDYYKKAQEELDKLCGDTPPTLEDFERCEYVRAYCKEVLRWYGKFASGLPHKYTGEKDDFYNGYRIPSGSILRPFNSAMAFNPKTYGQIYNVDLFEPRRWIERPGGVGKASLDDGLVTFGFGRRVCPGKTLALLSYTLLASQAFYYLDIGQKEGAVLNKPYDDLNARSGKADTSKFYIKARPGRQTELEHDAETAREFLKNLQ